MPSKDKNPRFLEDTGSLQEIFDDAFQLGARAAARGRVASYIPELGKADPYAFGIFAWGLNGVQISCGDTSTRFSIQSISKVISLAVALKAFGFHELFAHVLMEPSGDEFNSIIKLDTVSNLPFNPLINAGAIEVVSLLAQRFSFDELLS